ncbi:ABC transporter ATP-binding protein [Romboutsia sp. Marseille-P6047]|uniref:ABC transporter ATP-binding protein n=1 Tax=Romboutsia sp. Marseille-P6047 TaxID=2161817 RepID=UPI000F05A88E|nr:ABC transporter ATP-binding protein [Romboutsia sp. Marseille-P6047]
MSKVILECKNINKKYKKKDHDHIAADNISFQLKEGECLGVVGESGCGKSTLAKIIMNLEKSDSGEVILNDKCISNIKGKQLRYIYKDIQMVFQDAIGSFNPKITIGKSIEEYVCSLCSLTKEDKEATVDNLLRMVGLPIEMKNRYPHELSGGQCQRAAIARALSSHPKVLICDEVTSALDVSVQAQVIELLIHMKNEFNISYVFITHDLALVSSFCDRVIVMKDGKIVEEGSSTKIINRPKHEYTKLLLNSIF